MKANIKNILFLNENDIEKREIKVMLTNDTVITIAPCWESYQQYGGTVDEMLVTLPIAQKYNNWLHGEEFI